MNYSARMVYRGMENCSILVAVVSIEAHHMVHTNCPLVNMLKHPKLIGQSLAVEQTTFIGH